jgi:hypothetical protein
MGEFDSRHNTLAFGKVLGAQTRAPDWSMVGRVKIVCMYVCVCVCVCVCVVCFNRDAGLRWKKSQSNHDPSTVNQ